MREMYLWRYYVDCGRAGNIESVFVATKQEIKNAIGKDIYFGDILGKYSDVSVKLLSSEFEKLDVDSETVIKLSQILGNTWSGYNPLEYIV